MKCNDIIRLLEELCPPHYALEWDNVGLIVGSRSRQVRSVLVALDATEQVIGEAVSAGVDMIVTHHPLLFRGIKQVNSDDFIGRKLIALIENGICCYAMHTNYDVAGDMCRILAEKLKLHHEEVLDATSDDGLGIGIVGEIESVSLGDFAARVKSVLQIPYITLYGDDTLPVSRAAVSPGSGKSIVGAALKKQAQVLITGDIDYHTAVDSIQQGLMILDAGHYATEKIMVSRVGAYLREKLTLFSEEIPVKIIEAKSDNPFKII